jgi:hypothetical protein
MLRGNGDEYGLGEQVNPFDARPAVLLKRSA